MKHRNLKKWIAISAAAALLGSCIGGMALADSWNTIGRGGQGGGRGMPDQGGWGMQDQGGWGMQNQGGGRGMPDQISSATVAATVTTGDMIDVDSLFTKRDLEQTADTSDATFYTVSDGQDISITSGGVYVLTGTASNVTVTVDAEDSDKVQLVLQGVQITNADFPCIYVKEADKVFITTSEDSSLTVTGSFRSDGSTKTDAVIFSRSDVVLNGTATLTISSSKNGVTSKDDLKVTGGTYVITAKSKCMEANDSIAIADGTFTLNAGTDGLHAENSKDDSLGYVYIGGGSLTINADDDGIHAQTIVQIDGGTLVINAREGIEGTYIIINGGDATIQSNDDGINASNKSTKYRTTAMINDGTLKISMASGDTDGVDSNGDLVIAGGTISVTGASAFDWDGELSFTGGSVYVNGQQVSTITNQMMGGMGGMGGWGSKGGWGGW